MGRGLQCRRRLFQKTQPLGRALPRQPELGARRLTDVVAQHLRQAARKPQRHVADELYLLERPVLGLVQSWFKPLPTRLQRF
jgi:hypothetical protein